jgi:hypothetical protein
MSTRMLESRRHDATVTPRYSIKHIGIRRSDRALARSLLIVVEASLGDAHCRCCGLRHATKRKGQA